MFASRMKIARVGRAAAAERQFARVGRAAAAPRQFASRSGARAYLPKFSTVALSGTVLVVGGGLAYDRWMTKMHHSEIIWHGSDRGALPPTEQRFFFTSNEGFGMFELQTPISVPDDCWNTGTNTDDHKECKDAPAATLTWMGASAVTNYNDGMNCPVTMVVGSAEIKLSRHFSRDASSMAWRCGPYRFSRTRLTG